MVSIVALHLLSATAAGQNREDEEKVWRERNRWLQNGDNKIPKNIFGASAPQGIVTLPLSATPLQPPPQLNTENVKLSEQR